LVTTGALTVLTGALFAVVLFAVVLIFPCVAAIDMPVPDALVATDALAASAADRLFADPLFTAALMLPCVVASDVPVPNAPAHAGEMNSSIAAITM